MNWEHSMMLIPAQFGEKEEIYPWKKSNQNALKITNDYHEYNHSYKDAPPVTLRGNFGSPINESGIFLDCGSIFTKVHFIILSQRVWKSFYEKNRGCDKKHCRHKLGC